MSARAAARPSPLLAPLLLTGLAAATALRLGLAGAAGPASTPAALAFAAALVGLAVTAGVRPRVPRLSSGAAGVAGAAVLCAVPAAIRLLGHGAGPATALPDAGWAAAVVAVATAEEMAFRGALHDAVAAHAGDVVAVVVGAVAFGLLHVALYGSGALLLDTAVGLWLGALRVATGSVAGPAAAHTLADLAAWWLR